ncbi:MAG TPA: type II toxin-antitoxin system RatA family toxin [Pseudomonadales bacterium]|nr:type II toxin-antitoxin system RatA family toxin [Pseudomonadales bacterium]MCP5332982.1 type II toxin-antitoxin system RatA family toxin [Pseudomonadales bacterium]HNH71970.1 type II toxin-antitoxin system RatA family toxin [Pseudomonadales bacterium]HNI65233.1 type II toxin-antitoxin system RatA family toxin [Pseudomonadales bacterium]HNN36693.1 type II toxin-antitoxin system RatA family toxin [Pseudomonadales bacterium]
MTRIRRTVLLPYPVEKLYALINDIERYPEFMEGCVGAQLLCVEPDTLVARLDLAKGPLRQSFTTRNHLHPPHSIRMELEAGPFSQFAGQWQLDALGTQGCKVSLDLEFELASKLISLAAGKLFQSVADQMVDAICLRAHTLLGAARP